METEVQQALQVTLLNITSEQTPLSSEYDESEKKML
jgi:hypothetical protein